MENFTLKQIMEQEKNRIKEQTIQTGIMRKKENEERKNPILESVGSFFNGLYSSKSNNNIINNKVQGLPFSVYDTLPQIGESTEEIRSRNVQIEERRNTPLHLAFKKLLDVEDDTQNAFTYQATASKPQVFTASPTIVSNDNLEQANINKIEIEPTISEFSTIQSPNVSTTKQPSLSKLFPDNLESTLPPIEVDTERATAIPSSTLNIIYEGESKGNYNQNYALAIPYSKYKDGKKFTEMTIKEILEYQAYTSKETGKSDATGAAQIQSNTLKMLLKEGVVKDTDLFNEKTQDKLALALTNQKKLNKNTYGTGNGKISSTIKSINYDTWIKKLETAKNIEEKIKFTQQFQLGISTVWAAVPVPFDVHKLQIEKVDNNTFRPKKTASGKYVETLISKGDSYYKGVSVNSSQDRADSYTRDLLVSQLDSKEEIEKVVNLLSPSAVEQGINFAEKVAKKIKRKIFN